MRGQRRSWSTAVRAVSVCVADVVLKSAVARGIFNGGTGSLLGSVRRRRIGNMLRTVVAGVAALSMGLAGQAQVPKTHRLEATPKTVAYGYYWADAPPVLRIASGDIVDVDTLL